MQVALLPWRYDAEMDSWTRPTRYMFQRNMASIMKVFLVWIYLFTYVFVAVDRDKKSKLAKSTSKKRSDKKRKFYNFLIKRLVCPV